MASVRGTSEAPTTACSAGDTGRGIVMPVAALFFGAAAAGDLDEAAAARTEMAEEAGAARRGGAREAGRRRTSGEKKLSMEGVAIWGFSSVASTGFLFG